MRDLGEQLRTYIDDTTKPLALDDVASDSTSQSPRRRVAIGRWRRSGRAIAIAFAVMSTVAVAIAVARLQHDDGDDSSVVARPDDRKQESVDECALEESASPDATERFFDHATGQTIEMSVAEYCRQLASSQPYSDLELQTAGIDVIAFVANGELQVVYEEARLHIEGGVTTYGNTGIEVPPDEVARRVAAAKTFHCEPGDPNASFADPATGLTDYNKIPHWMPVISVAAGGHTGCVPRALLFPEIDGEQTLNRYEERAQLGAGQSVPLPVFGPDGALVGYVVGTYVDLEAADGLLTNALRSHPPTPDEFVPSGLER